MPAPKEPHIYLTEDKAAVRPQLALAPKQSKGARERTSFQTRLSIPTSNKSQKRSW